MSRALSELILIGDGDCQAYRPMLSDHYQLHDCASVEEALTLCVDRKPAALVWASDPPGADFGVFLEGLRERSGAHPFPIVRLVDDSPEAEHRTAPGPSVADIGKIGLTPRELLAAIRHAIETWTLEATVRRQQDLIAALQAGHGEGPDEAATSRGSFNDILIDSLDSEVCVLDEKGMILAVNRAWQECAEIHGQHAGGLGVGANYLAVCDRAARDDAPAEQVAAAIRAVLAGQQAQVAVEYHCTTPAGETRWFNARIARYRALGPVRVVIAHDDTTALKRTEQELQFSQTQLAGALVATRENEERLRLAWRATRDVLWDWDARHDALRWSPASLETLGWTEPFEGPQAGAWWSDRIHPMDRPRVVTALDGVLCDPAGERWEDEYRFRRADGGYADVLDRGFVLRNGDGIALRMIGAMRDISASKAAESALRLSEQRLQLALQVSQGGAWDWDLQRDQVETSHSYRELYGLLDDQAITFESSMASVYPEDRERCRRYLEAFFRSGTDFRMEFRIDHPQRGPRWLDSVGHLQRDDGGQPTRFIGITLDITARREAEAALRNSEQLMRLAQDAAHAGAWEWETGSGRHTWSDSLWTLFDLVPGQVEPSFAVWTDTIHPDDRDTVSDTLLAAVAAGREFERHWRVRRAAGLPERWLLARGQPSAFAQGRAERYLGIVIDITRQKQAEQALAASEQRLAGLVHSAMDAIVTVDEAQRIRLFNPAAEQMFGVTAGDILGEPLARLIPERFRHAHPERVRGFGETGTSKRRMGHMGQVVGLRANGTEFPIEAAISQARLPEGRLFTVILRDLSEREAVLREQKRADQQLKAQSLILEESFRHYVARQTGAAIAHELNQPLTAVASYTEVAMRLLKAENFDRDAMRYALENAEFQARRAGGTMHELMAMLHKGESPMEAFDLRAIIDEAIDLLRNSGELRGDPLTLRIAENLPPVRVNRLQIEKVLINLLRNALHALHDLEPPFRRIAVQADVAVDSENMACITVCDNGTGLSRQDFQSMFQPFYTTKSTGLGMGLAVSRALVEAHGGRLWAQPNAGPGASFHFTLPFAL